MSGTKRRRRRRETSRTPSFAFAPPRRAQSRIDWGERLGLAALPALIFCAHLFFGANHVVAAQWLTLAMALALVLSLAFPLNRSGLADIRPTWPLLLCFGAVLAVVLWTLTPGVFGASINRSATLLEVVKLLGLACAFVIGGLLGARENRGRATFDGLLGVGAVYAAIALLTFLAGTQVMSGNRLSGGFLSANSGATVFGLLSVLAVANLVRRWRKAAHSPRMTQLGAVATPLAYVLLFATCLLLTASRMGVAATAVAIGLFLMWDMIGSSGRRLPVLISGAVVALTGLVLLLRGNDLVWARLDALDQDLMVRTTLFQAHWQAFLQAPLFGHGLGTFNDINNQIMTPETYKDLWVVRATHNVYIQWLEEAGVVGATPMFLLIAVIIGVSAWRIAWNQGGQGDQTVQRGLAVSSLVVLIHSTTDYALQTPSIAAFWAFLLGLQFAFGRSRTKSGSSSDA